uniref:Uncharacterized protein n=1 Tax=Pseudomonas phage Cygsa01 TaxID=3138529 RepID=A0AAU6W4M0_9VIRU
MAIPDYADDRARQFFDRGFVGQSHGDEGQNGWRYSWNATADGLHATAVHTCDRLRPVCAYCGEHALPVQKELPYSDRHSSRYIDKGYTCCCSGAMDERDYVALRETMLQRHAQELEELESAAPVPPLHIAQAYGRKAAEKALGEISTWGCRDLNEINMKMGAPPKGNNFE